MLRGSGAEGAFHQFNEAPLFTENEAATLRQGKIVERFAIGAQPRLVLLVSGEAVKSNHAPADIVRALIREVIPDEAASAAGNDAAPVFRVLFEAVALGGIDFIMNDAQDFHGSPERKWRGSAGCEGDESRDERSDSFAASEVTQAHGICPMKERMRRDGTPCFDYHQSMNVETEHDETVARVAAAIGEPARARMLYALLDGHARTSTELAVIGGVTPSTASSHLTRMKSAGLIELQAQGKHRYYGLSGRSVAAVLESLSVLAGARRPPFRPTTPDRLRVARRCYDHIAGAVGVALHDRFAALGWIAARGGGGRRNYQITGTGGRHLEALGVNVEEMLGLRRRLAFPCLDWSERRPHLGGALGAALLQLALRRRWVEQEAEVRALRITTLGRREMKTRFGMRFEFHGD